MATIIIAEKPDACEHIAKALAEKELKKKTSSSGVNYYEFLRKGKKHIVIAAVGHLFNLKQDGSGWTYPIFDVKWIPSFQARKQSEFSKKYFQTIEEIIKNNGKSDFISACDYDNEGSMIAWNILRFMCNAHDAKRMKFSTLTKPDLVKAYDEMSAHLDWQNIECGEARHYLDFYWGINSSRALISAIKKSSPRFAILSAGRVQGPTLCLLAEKEKEIMKFVTKPYWQLELILLINGNEIAAVYEKEKLWDRTEAEKIFSSCKGKAVVDDVEKKQYKQAPPVPFNITSLQTEAYRLFGYSPQQTMRIAQDLYTKAFISYPRTSSEKLLPQIGFAEIIKALSKIKKYAQLCKELLAGELKPTEGKRSDAAHEAIHPTIETPSALKGPHQKIYDLICRRFFSVFGKNALRESMKIIIDVNGFKFSTTGRRTLEKGWMEFYGPYANFDEIILPELKKGDRLKTKDLKLLSKQTSPPARFSQASIIKEMEKRGLGTRATRAAILQTLYDRNYVEGKSVKVTKLGLHVADVLKKYVPDLVDEKLTRRFEKDLEKIFEEKIKKERVLAKARSELKKIFDDFRTKQDKIGKELGKAVVETQNESAVLGRCPNCGGDLKLLFSPFSKKKFVGCSSYNRCKACGFTKKACKCACLICGGEKGKCKCVWKEKVWNPSCQTGYPLPHNASFQKTEKVCEKCKTPIITVIRKGKRPFRMCLDPKCETKKDWGKPKKEKQKGRKQKRKPKNEKIDY